MKLLICLLAASAVISVGCASSTGQHEDTNNDVSRSAPAEPARTDQPEASSSKSDPNQMISAHRLDIYIRSDLFKLAQAHGWHVVLGPRLNLPSRVEVPAEAYKDEAAAREWLVPYMAARGVDAAFEGKALRLEERTDGDHQVEKLPTGRLSIAFEDCSYISVIMKVARSAQVETFVPVQPEGLVPRISVHMRNCTPGDAMQRIAELSGLKLKEETSSGGSVSYMFSWPSD